MNALRMTESWMQVTTAMWYASSTQYTQHNNKYTSDLWYRMLFYLQFLELNNDKNVKFISVLYSEYSGTQFPISCSWKFLFILDCDYSFVFLSFTIRLHQFWQETKKKYCIKLNEIPVKLLDLFWNCYCYFPLKHFDLVIDLVATMEYMYIEFKHNQTSYL